MTSNQTQPHVAMRFAPSPSERSDFRRPSGEPPPLPRQINKSAIAWLFAFGLWVVVWLWAFFRSDAGIWINERELKLMARDGSGLGILRHEVGEAVDSHSCPGAPVSWRCCPSCWS